MKDTLHTGILSTGKIASCLHSTNTGFWGVLHQIRVKRKGEKRRLYVHLYLNIHSLLWSKKKGLWSGQELIKNCSPGWCSLLCLGWSFPRLASAVCSSHFWEPVRHLALVSPGSIGMSAGELARGEDRGYSGPSSAGLATVFNSPCKDRAPVLTHPPPQHTHTRRLSTHQFACCLWLLTLIT